MLTLRPHQSILVLTTLLLGTFSALSTAFTIPEAQIRQAQSNLLFLGSKASTASSAHAIPYYQRSHPSRSTRLYDHVPVNSQDGRNHDEGTYHRPASRGGTNKMNNNIWRLLRHKARHVRIFGRNHRAYHPSRWMNRVRRMTFTLCAALMLWVGSTTYVPTPPAHAASAPSSVIQRIVLPSASLDQMVDRYVKDHMFDDDVYDPVESAYRETYHDSTTGIYPSKLKDITAGILGKDAVAERKEGENKIMAVFESGAKLLTRFGVPEQTAQIILAVATMAGAFFSFVLVFGGTSVVLKTGMNREMKRRYGDDFTMDASSIKDPAPVTNDDDDDDDDSDDDDDGDDDEDDDDE